MSLSSLTGVMDGWPIAVQLGVMLAAFVFSLAVTGASVKLARRKEPTTSATIAIPTVDGSFTLASLQPVREAIAIMAEMLKEQREQSITLSAILTVMREGATEDRMAREVDRRVREVQGRNDPPMPRRR